jgi:hypothetical protein
MDRLVISVHGKGNREREIPIVCDGLRESLEQHLAERQAEQAKPDDPLFVNRRGTRMSDQSIRSVIRRYATRNHKVEMAPAYDFLNSTIALRNSKEEMALPLKGKKSGLTPHDFLNYYARERLQINERVLSDVLSRFTKAIPLWRKLLDQSFLSEEAKQKFSAIIDKRGERMGL